MYEVLVAHLRECEKLDPSNNTYKEAADAIEELNGFVQEAERDRDEYRERLDKSNDVIEELMRRCKQFQYMPLPAWIPVTERLPEDDTDVLCWYEYYHWSAEKVLPEYGIGHCWNGRWGGEVSNGCECKVLAWMSLPQPPKEET